MDNAAPSKVDSHSSSVIAPLKNPTFRAVWLSTQVSSLGWLVQTVAVGWLMSSISASSVMVALVQASASLPAFLISIFAGAIADSFSHRAVMVTGRCVITSAFALMTLLLAAGLVSPWAVLGLSFLAGCGVALNNPAWQASVSDIVDRREIPAAVVLISAGFNTIRSIGPALGGVLVALWGPVTALALATLGNLAPLWALWRRRWPTEPSQLPRQSLPTAIYDGLQFAAMSSDIRASVLRGTLLGLCGIAVLALLPVVVRDQIGGKAADYGILMAAFGVGALLVSVCSGPLHRLLSRDQLIMVACGACAACSACLAVTSWLPLAAISLIVGGAGWTAAWSELGVSVQLASPRWVVGRSLSIYYAFTYGGIALGSWLWGAVAEYQSLHWALNGSAVAMLAVMFSGTLMPLRGTDNLHNPLERMEAPQLGLPINPNSGPIVVSVEYCIGEANLATFLDGMGQRRRSQSRAGARSWRLQRDLNDPARWIETYRTPTWTDYLRVRLRLTSADLRLEESIRGLHERDAPPVTSLAIERSPYSHAKSQSVVSAVHIT